MRYRGWGHGEEDLHAVIARTFGTKKATLAVLTTGGEWRAVYASPFDPAGAPDSWRWPS